MKLNKNITAVCASSLCAVLLCGCGTASEPAESGSSGAFDRYEITTTQPITEAPTDAPTEAPTTALPVTEPPTTTAGGLSVGIQIGGEKTDPPADSTLSTLRAAAETLYYASIYPNGTDCILDGFGQITDIQFAVIDIDEDGEMELMLRDDFNCMAAMVEYVFGVDDAGNIVEEYCAFPATTYYTGGYVTSGVSHNQGHAGRFWPYGVSRYNPATGVYEDIAFVDAWDGESFPTGYEGEAFPHDIDTSGTGIVYYINQNGADAEPIDVTAYEAWYSETLGGRSEITIPYRNLTEANIAEAFR